jgi:hypothetical protein
VKQALFNKAYNSKLRELEGKGELTRGFWDRYIHTHTHTYIHTHTHILYM